MSLSYSLPAPLDRFYEDRPEDPAHWQRAGKYLREDVESCILWTMATAVGSLTSEEVAREHYQRALVLWRLGAHADSHGQPVEPFSLATALSLVGLRVNVTRRPLHSWGADAVKRAMGDLRWELRAREAREERAADENAAAADNP